MRKEQINQDKDAQRAGQSQKLSQQQEREVRRKSSIANIAISAAEGPFSALKILKQKIKMNLPYKFHSFNFAVS